MIPDSMTHDALHVLLLKHMATLVCKCLIHVLLHAVEWAEAFGQCILWSTAQS